MSPEERRPFRGAPFDRSRGDRPGPDRGDRPVGGGPGFGAPRPFVRPPTRGGDMAPPDHRVHLRDGDREIEVSGNPAFVRQVLDDLPALMARLRGEAAGRTTISMPPPPAREAVAVVERADAPPPAVEEAPAVALNGSRKRQRHADAPSPVEGGSVDLERQVFDVLRGSGRPLAISAIRERLEGQPTGQEVRRLLERAGDRVSRSTERPATYSLR